MTKERVTLAAIMLLAASLRFWKLGSNPPSLYWDEASLGYNAYSILKTGRDEHGEFLPLARFIAFGDYKPPGYIYAAVPSIALFGLTEFAVRFPSALAGTLTVLVTYLLVKELFDGNKKNRNHKPSAISHQSSVIALLAAFLLAISPWHLQFSRAAFEANLATFFSTAGAYLFMKGIKNGKFLVLSFAFFALSMYTFNTHRIVIPMLVITLAMIYRDALRKHGKALIAAVILGLALITPQIPFLLSREGQLRFQEVAIFRNLDPVVTANERIEREGGTLWAKAVHNRRVQFLLEMAKHYADNLRPDFLFFSGDINPRLGTRDQGLLYLIELPLMVTGGYFLIRKKQRHAKLLFLWWLLGLIPAATARETPHALRTLNILPVPQIITAFGIVSLYDRLKRSKIFLSLLIISYSFLFISYLHTYYVHNPIKWAAAWQYGYKQMVERVTTIEQNYDRVFVTTRYGRPHIYFLFYKMYPPQRYWETRNAERDWFGFWTVSGFDIYTYKDPPVKDPQNQEKWLLVTGPHGLPVGSEEITSIDFPNGERAFEVGEVK